MKTQIITVFCLIMICTSCDTNGQKGDKNKIYWGDKVKLDSKILGHERDLYIYVPYDYEWTSDTYPVLITTDAQELFYFTASTAELMANKAKIPKMIVVGILNRGKKERHIDFAPKVDSIPQSGRGELFIDFIEKELKPYIQKNYRTQPFWILQGHSFLGMFSAHTLINNPDLFNAMILSSPGLQWIENEINNDLPKTDFVQPTFIYISRGDNEPEDIAEKEMKMMNKLEQNLSNFENVHVKADTNINADHQTNSMLSTIHGLEYIYNGYITPKPYRELTMNELKQHFSDLSKKYGYEIPIPDRIKRQIKK